MKYGLVLLLLLCSCSPNSSTDFQKEGEARCSMLVEELKKISNREQLLQAQEPLKKHFEALIDLMITAIEFQNNHLDDIVLEPAFDEQAAEIVLEEELRRIYTIEGGREVIERAEQEALVRFDSHKRTLAKKNQKVKKKSD